MLVATVAVLGGTPALAATTGNQTAATAAGGAGWGGTFTAGNLSSANDVWAITTADNDYGVLSSFGFAVPASATVTGITALVNGSRNAGGGTVDYAVQLSWDGGATWTTAMADSFTSNADATDTLGGATVTWGRSWSASDFSNANFRLRIYRTGGSDATRQLRLDQVQVAVTYTPTSLYRSVGTNAANLNVGHTVEIIGTTATFSGSMPANVGVGDVLQYQVAATFHVAFVHGRVSDTVYTVHSATGLAPQAAAAGTAVGVYRAYTSLDAWHSQDENNTLDNSVENFDTSTNLPALNASMHVACYGDGVDTTAVTIDNWTTALENYIRIYTPVSASEVGASQRHAGLWDTSRYRLQANPGGGGAGVIRIETNYVRLDGLQVWMTADVGDVAAIVVTNVGGASAYEISNNIVRGNGAGTTDIRIGINAWTTGTGPMRIWNNVIYDWRCSAACFSVSGILPDDAALTYYVSNNTVVDNQVGIDVEAGVVYAKNNLVYNNVDNYRVVGGSFHATSTNNLSGPVQADAPGLNPRNAATVTFVNAAGDDFHLAAGDAGAQNQGADLSGDANLAFAVDIDGATRVGPPYDAWDIGADEYTGPAATKIYYSIGTQATALYSGNAAATTGTLTLASAAPLNVGVGDEIQLGASRYYITGRSSSTVFTIQDSAANSGTPGDTNISFASTPIEIYRAFNSIAAAVTGSSNASHLATSNLVTNNYQLNWPCYADGIVNGASNLNGYATGYYNYVRLYTPVASSEVGVSQRHRGVFGTGFQVNGTSTIILPSSLPYLRIEGLTIQLTDSGGSNKAAIDSNPPGLSDVRISHNIIKGVFTAASTDPAGIAVGNNNANIHKVYNNIIYNFDSGQGLEGIRLDDGFSYVFNNTMYRCDSGIREGSGGDGGEVRNNIAVNTGTSYELYTVTESDNISSDGTGTPAGLRNKTSYAAYFRSITPGSEDLHLQNTSLVLFGASGADLSGHAILAITDDVDGAPRVRPDHGADEVGLVQPHYRWRNDDGSEAAASWAAAEDAALTGFPKLATRRLRLQIANQASLSSGPVAYELQVAQTATCAAGSYAAVPTAPGGHWQIVASGFVSDGQATTNVAGGLTDAAASFVPGEVKDSGNPTGAITLAGDSFSEIEFSLQAAAAAADGASYCFRLYDAASGTAAIGYSAYAQATLQLPTLVLSAHPAGQVGDQFTNTSPVTTALLRFQLASILTVTVDTLRVRFSTSGGVASGDVTAGELWLDANGDGSVDGGDTLVQGGVAGAAGVLTFTTNFAPAGAGSAYLVRATVANLTAGDTTTLLLDLADIDEMEAGVAETGSIAGATHTQDGIAGGDIYYSVGTSAADLKTGAPTITLASGLATLSVAQTGNVGLGDMITYSGATIAYVKAVLGPTQFLVQTRNGGVPPDVAGQTVNSIRRAFNTIAAAESGSTDGAHLGTADLVTGGYRLTWVCYNDGPFNVAATTIVTGYTTDATRYITLTVAGASDVVSGVSQRHSGRAGTGVVVEATTALDPALNVAQAYTRVEWLEIDGNDFLGAAGIHTTGGGTRSLFRNLLIHNVSSTTPGTFGDGIGIAFGSTGGFEEIRNSFIFDFDEDGIAVSSSNVTIANCTIFRTRKTANGGEGIHVGGAPASASATNVLSMVNALGSSLANDFFVNGGGVFTCNYCISNDTTADDFGGVGNLINRPIANQFVSITSYADLHLKPGSDALDAGTSLAASFADDIDGQARPFGSAWDVGADEGGGTLGLIVRGGSYGGDGTNDRAIYVGFQPDLVIVDSQGTTGGTNAVIRTASMSGDASKEMDRGTPTALGTNQVKSLTATGFTVGTDADVNETGAGRTYHWVAMRAGAGAMKVGSYTGNGTTQTIAGLGFTPVYVIVIPATSQDAMQRSATMPAGFSQNFVAFAVGDGITAFGGDSFSVGANARVNANGATYHYAAWAAVPGQVQVGSYLGNGVNDRDITGTGFLPQWVVLTESYANGTTGAQGNAPAHKPASTGTGADLSLLLNTNATAANNVKALLADGFRVGTDGRVNSTTAPNAYHWAAFGPYSATSNYRSIGTAAPLTNQGTITVSAGSRVVTKSGGTGWRTDNRGRGDRLTVNGTDHYVIAAVIDDDQLVLTTPAVNSYSGGSYTIARQFASLEAWYDCIARNTTCTYFQPASSSLVADGRREVGIAYKEAPLTISTDWSLSDATTDAAHDITLTADPGNRHLGIAGNGARVNHSGFSIRPADAYWTIEWLEFYGGSTRGLHLSDASSSPNKLVIRNCLFRNHGSEAIRTFGDWDLIEIYNNFVYASGQGIDLDVVPTQALVANNTVYNNPSGGILAGAASPGVTLRNNVSMNNGTDFGFTSRNAASSHNLSSDNTATTNSPAGGGLNGILATTNAATCGDPEGCVGFQTLGATPNLHLINTSYVNQAVGNGADLSSSFTARDIDDQIRGGAWDRGADELDGTTAVKLLAFTAQGYDGSVLLEWQTGSELMNLGFHLYRGASADGPWTRLTAQLVPGLGSSPEGKAYSWIDRGLRNGTRYHYRLEDVEATSRVTSHGPISAVPQAGAGGPGDDGEGGRSSSSSRTTADTSCPAWVLAAYDAAVDSAAAGRVRCTRHGDPETVSLSELSRDSRQVTLELRTGGFYALHEAGGTVRAFIPGFDFPQDEKAVALPFRRVLTDAEVGRRVQLGGVRALDVVAFRGLVPSALGKAEMQLAQDGTARAVRRGTRAIASQLRRLDAGELVTLLPSQFQGEKKSAVLLLSPLRYDERRRQLVLAKVLRLRLLFTGREPGESGRGSRGRAPLPRQPEVSGEVLARLHTTSRGLHAVAFEQLFPGQARAVPVAGLRLERQGEPVAFHVEPAGSSFGPGGRLLFYAARVSSSTEFSAEQAYELVSALGGVQMPLQSAAPGSLAAPSPSTVTRSFETNRFYQPGLLAAEDPWLWEAVGSGVTRARSFALSAVSASGTAELSVHLQGASESGMPVDHHLSVAVNGVPVGDAQFAGMQPYRVDLSLPASLLREGDNELALTNVADTGVSSLVFLDRFELAHPQAPAATGGVFEGTWPESGTASIAGVSPAALLDVTAAPRWLTGWQAAGGGLSFAAEAGKRYLAVAPEALLAPRVERPQPSTLLSTANQADYLLIAPQALLPAAAPLLERRRDSGLAARAVSLEEIAAEFGHGQPSAEAIKAFVAHAFHSWARPSPRYLLLFGDSSYDPRNFMGSSQPSPLPALWTRTSYLLTVSDPLLAAVNGEDPLPDLAIGRLPATTPGQAEALVAKLLAWEDSGQALAGAATLVADNPDLAGDFEADAEDIRASFLSSRPAAVLRLRELGAGTRGAILDSLNEGRSFLSYMGHGGAAVWASENVWNSWDAASLQEQSRQPLLVTMNCLNGYFVAPSYESLSESLVKAEGRGAIAAFSPSGLSLNGPAHEYHRALMAELVSGRHERLGDALLAAQSAYAGSGQMPELLAVYHLLGDPAARIR